TIGLEEVGIERTQSHRWQQIAALPSSAFETYIAETKAQAAELTTAGALRLARDLRKLDGQQQRQTDATSFLTRRVCCVDASTTVPRDRASGAISLRAKIARSCRTLLHAWHHSMAWHRAPSKT